MKKIPTLLFAFAMIFSLAFIAGEFSSGDNSFSASAQTVRAKRKRSGVARKSWRGGKYVARKSWQGGKYVARKSWQGGKWTARKTASGAKWTARKTSRGTKKVFRKTKNVVY